MRTKLFKIAQAATFALAITFTLSCSSGGDGDPTCGGRLYDTGKYGCVNNELVGTCGGRYYNPEYQQCLNGDIQNGAEITFPSSGSGGDGAAIPTKTSAIKDITGDSFTIVEDGCCQENGTLEKDISEETISYTISGSTLSFGGAQFRGNSSSLIGTWIASSLQDIDFDGMTIGDVKKVVFTQNTFTVMQCAGEPGEEREYRNGSILKVIDCDNVEFTKGNETVKVRSISGGAMITATYKGKTCIMDQDVYPESQMQKACSDAYKKVMRENPGYDGSGDEVHDYYHEILRNQKDRLNCRKDFPEWFIGNEKE